MNSMNYVGLDIHKRSVSCCVRRAVDALNAEWNRGRFPDAPHLTHDMRALSDNDTPLAGRSPATK